MSVRSLNKVLLIGNLTRDPELRYTPTGTAVCTFGIATNRSWVPSDGSERQEETEYHRIVAWSKLAEICSQILSKGRKVYVEGRIQNRKWQTQEGVERETTEIVIDNMIALSPPKNGGGYGSGAGYEESYESEAPQVETQEIESGEDVVDAAITEDENKSQKEAVSPKKSDKKAAKTEGEDVSIDDIPF